MIGQNQVEDMNVSIGSELLGKLVKNPVDVFSLDVMQEVVQQHEIELRVTGSSVLAGSATSNDRR